MKKLLLVKYAPEIFLKGLNKGKFERKLIDNIKSVLKDLKYDFVNDTGRWFLEFEDIEEGLRRVKRVFGVSEVCIVTEVEADMEEIKKQALKEAADIKGDTFKVQTNRANK